jgi:hypothetical protein
MPTVTSYTNLTGDEMISVVYDDGTSWSGYKSAYDAQQAQANPTPQANSTES